MKNIRDKLRWVGDRLQLVNDRLRAPMEKEISVPSGIFLISYAGVAVCSLIAGLGLGYVKGSHRSTSSVPEAYESSIQENIDEKMQEEYTLLEKVVSEQEKTIQKELQNLDESFKGLNEESSKLDQAFESYTKTHQKLQEEVSEFRKESKNLGNLFERDTRNDQTKTTDNLKSFYQDNYRLYEQKETY